MAGRARGPASRAPRARRADTGRDRRKAQARVGAGSSAPHHRRAGPLVGARSYPAPGSHPALRGLGVRRDKIRPVRIVRRLILAGAIGLSLGAAAVGGIWAWQADIDESQSRSKREQAQLHAALSASITQVSPGLWLYRLPPGECGSVLPEEVFQRAASGGFDEFSPALLEGCR